LTIVEGDSALGSDTGGSVRMPASYCGIVGFKPSYGRCSRYGLVAYANSLDTIGILSRTIEDCADVYSKFTSLIILYSSCLFLDVISKYDALDPTSMPLELRNEIDKKDKELASRWEKDLRGLVVGIPQEFYVDSLSPKVISAWREGIDRFKQLGAKIITVSMPHTPLALPAYYIIALAEASSNLARYDGVKYGKSIRLKKFWNLSL
jgi:aspartyl-tRNA(Asn)/glutamyl-tRNA(Gln) amidotransferase subunit A